MQQTKSLDNSTWQTLQGQLQIISKLLPNHVKRLWWDILKNSGHEKICNDYRLLVQLTRKIEGYPNCEKDFAVVMETWRTNNYLYKDGRFKQLVDLP